jgi:uncharacterized protein YdaU (DUF1376 family)
MNRPWFPFYVGDYTRDTARLTTEAHGAYLLLILDYWVNGPPPDDNDVLATITKLPLTIWKKRRASILPFFKVVDGRWTHSRIDREIAAADEKHQKRVEAGKEGGKAKAKGKQTSSNASPEPPALPYQSQSQPPSEPIPDSKKGESNPPSALKLVGEGKAIPIDESYVPSEPAIEYAYSLGMKKHELDDELRKFITKSISLRVVSFNIDMNFKLWCDRWLAFKRKDNPGWTPAPDVVPGSPRFWVDEGTLEWNCWQRVYNGGRGSPVKDHKDADGRPTGRRGWEFPSSMPEGFNDFGERIEPASEENAA